MDPRPHPEERCLSSSLVGDEAVRVAAGGFGAVPPGVVHDFRGPGPGPARILGWGARDGRLKEPRMWTRPQRSAYLRRLTVLVCVLSAAGGLAPPALGTQPPRADWAVVKYTALRDVEMKFGVSFRLTAPSKGPFVYGFASGITGKGAQTKWNGTYVGVMGGQRSADVAASAEGVAVRERVPWPAEVVLGDRSGHVSFSGTLKLRAGQTYALASFVPGGRVTSSQYHSAGFPRDGVRVSVRTGTGSSAIRVASSRHEGVGAEVSSVGAGAVAREAKVSKGLIGAGAVFCDCTGEWVAPDRRTGRWTAVDAVAIWPVCWCSGAFAVGDYSFAGGPGTWRWTWAGVTGARQAALVALYGLSAPVIAAYAPIGDDWKHFNGGPRLI